MTATPEDVHVARELAATSRVARTLLALALTLAATPGRAADPSRDDNATSTDDDATGVAPDADDNATGVAPDDDAPKSAPSPSTDWGDFETVPGAPATSPGGDWGDFESAPAPPEVLEPAYWSGTFSARARAGLWLERLGETPLATLRTSLDGTIAWSRGPWRLNVSGHAEVDPAFWLQSDDFDGPTVDRYASLIDVRKSHVAYLGQNADATFGFQIVPWGEALMLGALDVANPRDLREPGLADLEDIRLPVLSTRLGLGDAGHRVELLWVHEARFGYRSPPLGPHSLYRAFLPDDIDQTLGDRELTVSDAPDRWSLDAQQLFLRWTYRGSGVDLGLYAASALDQRGVPGTFDPLGSPAARRVALPLVHERFWLLGTSGVVPLEALLLKWEIAALPDRPLTALRAGDTGSTHVNVREPMLDLFASIVWDPSPVTQLAFEWQQLVPLDRTPGDEYLLHPDVPRLGLRVAHRAMEERLMLELLALVDVDLGGVLTAIVRATADYQLSDGWRIGVGAITYQPSSDRTGPLMGFTDNDQVFVRARWDFALE